MKKKSFLVFVGLFIVIGSYMVYRGLRAAEVQDVCDPYNTPTTFNASFPSSVTAGQAFTLSNITSHPSNSYGVTIQSANLELTATNASPSSYSKFSTSTDPSPTTGASSYTAHYPNWSLTAAGSAGNKIDIKLVKVTAQVSGIGNIVCNFS
ncbi:MAG: hypothetical protein ACRD4B_00330, partial [Acidobacteriota bacterium]